MGHVNTEPGQYDFAASGFIFKKDASGGYQLLLHMHKKLNRYMHFGGHVELDESPWQTIAHEVVEETGYELSQLQVLQPFTPIDMPDATYHPVPINMNSHVYGSIDHHHTDIAYAFITQEDPKHSVSEANESTEFIWVSRAELEAMDAEQTYENIRLTGLVAFDVILGTWQPYSATMFSTD